MVLFHQCLLGQQEAKNWHFGNAAGIAFTPNGVVTLPPSGMTTNEGCTTISDSTGNLLFYSDGIRVWNSSHQVMPNGTGLSGNISSSQSAVALPVPGNPDQYYLFSVDHQAGPNGVCYSIVDMSLDNGLGDVSATKNILLLNNTCEQISIVSHANPGSFWVVLHPFNDNRFYAYLVSDAGVSHTPVISNGGVHVTGLPTNAIGIVKFSPDGKKVAASYTRMNRIEILQFDASAGVLSNPIVLNDFGLGPHGIAFSPDNRKLYVAEEGPQLWQFDIVIHDSLTIGNSRKLIASVTPFFGQLQLAIDKKIYAARIQMPFLSVIDFPDNPGPACSFIDTAVPLISNSILGLPAFVQSYFNIGFYAENTCYGDTTTFVNLYNAPDSLNWSFHSINSTWSWQTNAVKPALLLPDAGSYSVTLTGWKQGVAYHYSDTIEIDIPYPIILPNDTLLCPGEQLSVNFSADPYIAVWCDSIISDTFTINSAGTYVVKVYQSGCVTADSITAGYHQEIVLPGFTDTVVCPGTTVQYNLPVNNYSYAWDDSSTALSRDIALPGNYWVAVTDSFCYSIDSFAIHHKVVPDINLGIDTMICSNATFSLYTSLPPGTFYWHNNSSSPEIPVSETGYYALFAVIDNCQIHDSIFISVEACECKVFVPNAFSPNNDGVNDYFFPCTVCDIKEYELLIFNRYGQVVFQTTDYNHYWDGVFSDKQSNETVFVWKLKIIMTGPLGDEQYFCKSGTVFLH
ncbi:MAG: gliding motility-associated C-terminal domain-containing protein [Bacteroidales bacterium]|nr:gliding motility-associated C-terminal domain-containing protein [Bacteroidales bacterium]